jgi:hypothetical protein
VSPSAEPLLFLQLAFTSTFFAGLVQASLGILRYDKVPCLYASHDHRSIDRSVHSTHADMHTRRLGNKSSAVLRGTHCH